jgi:hypothetical protein
MSKVVQSMTSVGNDASGAGSLASLATAQGFGTVAVAGSSFTWTPPSQPQALAGGAS